MIDIDRATNLVVGENTKVTDFKRDEFESPFGKLRELSEALGCKFFAMLHTSQSSQSPQDALLYSNWPTAAFDGSKESFPALDMGLAEMISGTIVPFQWSYQIDDFSSLSDADKQIAGLFQDFQLLEGLIIPVHGPDGNIGYAAFGAMENKLNSEEISTLQASVFELFDLHFKAIRKYLGSNVKLSQREVQILQFMVDGRGVDEIAKVMDLSALAIGIYASSAKSKLNASTKIQAIARALRSGFIR